MLDICQLPFWGAANVLRGPLVIAVMSQTEIGNARLHAVEDYVSRSPEAEEQLGRLVGSSEHQVVAGVNLPYPFALKRAPA